VKRVKADKPAFGAVSFVPRRIVDVPLEVPGEFRFGTGGCAGPEMNGVKRQIGSGHL
jgi:hypothetical protein